MAEYKVYFKKSVEKDLTTIPKKNLKKILRRIAILSENPRPAGHEKLDWTREVPYSPGPIQKRLFYSG